MNKHYFYQTNNIYNGYTNKPFPDDSVYMYTMVYYGLGEEVKEYYNSDIFKII